MEHINAIREGYQKQLQELITRQSLLQQELTNVGAAIQQYQGALKALDHVQAAAPAAPALAQPATPVTTTPETK